MLLNELAQLSEKMNDAAFPVGNAASDETGASGQMEIRPSTAARPMSRRKCPPGNFTSARRA